MILSKKEELRREILSEIKKFETEHLRTKSDLRKLHKPSVDQMLLKAQPWIHANMAKYSGYFADGKDINPEKIKPVLIEVKEGWHADVFRLARYTWSLSFTKGYGRRLRFLILDESNGKLIGILGLQSPPLDFKLRDTLFDYPEGRKVEMVNQTMDIYSLGALPPYNRLLGGKLVALAAASNEVREAYRRKYQGATTILEGKKIPARLIALTTTSAFGRSSLYNRLKYDSVPIAISIGYTQGYGSFHLSGLYPKLREFLESEGIPTRGGYGVGPRIVWTTCSRALTRLGLSTKLLRHGIHREAFLFPLAINYKSYFDGKTKSPTYYNRSFENLSFWWRERWLISRASRVNGWHKWESKTLLTQISSIAD